MIYLSYGLLQLGFLLLALSQAKHYKTLIRPKPKASPKQQWLFKVIGFALIAMVGFIYCAQYGIGLGLVWWFGLMCPATMLVALLLAYRQRS